MMSVYWLMSRSWLYMAGFTEIDTYCGSYLMIHTSDSPLVGNLVSGGPSEIRRWNNHTKIMLLISNNNDD